MYLFFYFEKFVFIFVCIIHGPSFFFSQAFVIYGRSPFFFVTASRDLHVMYIYFYDLINCSGIVSFITDLLYKANLNTGSVLEYALAFTSAALDKYCSKWSAAPKTGFIDITISKDFYRIYSGLQIVRSNLPQLTHFIIYTIMS